MNNSHARVRVIHAILAGLTAAAVACGDKSAVLAPTDSPPPAPPVVVSGTVYEHGPFGQRPLGGIGVYAAPGSQSAPAVTSDADGRYRFTAPTGTDLTLVAEAGTHGQPCRARTLLAADTNLDVHVVPRAVLTTSGIPPSLPIAGPRVSGHVFDATTGEDRPIAGAWISGTFADARLWGPSVFTLSDAEGRYLLCGPGDRIEVVAFVPRLFGEGRVAIDLVETPVAIWDFRLFSLD